MLQNKWVPLILLIGLFGCTPKSIDENTVRLQAQAITFADKQVKAVLEAGRNHKYYVPVRDYVYIVESVDFEEVLNVNKVFDTLFYSLDSIKKDIYTENGYDGSNLQNLETLLYHDKSLSNSRIEKFRQSLSRFDSAYWAKNPVFKRIEYEWPGKISKIDSIVKTVLLPSGTVRLNEFLLRWSDGQLELISMKNQLADKVSGLREIRCGFYSTWVDLCPKIAGKGENVEVEVGIINYVSTKRLTGYIYEPSTHEKIPMESIDRKGKAIIKVRAMKPGINVIKGAIEVKITDDKARSIIPFQTEFYVPPNK